MKFAFGAYDAGLRPHRQLRGRRAEPRHRVRWSSCAASTWVGSRGSTLGRRRPGRRAHADRSRRRGPPHRRRRDPADLDLRAEVHRPDPRPGEGEGPFLADGDEIDRTRPPLELEDILGDADELLEAVDPEDFTTVLHTFAEGVDGLDQEMADCITNGQTVLDAMIDSSGDRHAAVDGHGPHRRRARRPTATPSSASGPTATRPCPRSPSTRTTSPGSSRRPARCPASLADSSGRQRATCSGPAVEVGRASPTSPPTTWRARVLHRLRQRLRRRRSARSSASPWPARPSCRHPAVPPGLRPVRGPGPRPRVPGPGDRPRPRRRQADEGHRRPLRPLRRAHPRA